MSSYDHLVNSAVGVTVAEICTLPLCTIKTLYQNDNNNTKPLNIIKQVYKKYGVYGFYNASIPSVSAQIISMSFKWAFYKRLGGNDSKKNSLFTNIKNGVVSGLTVSIITHPLDFNKIYLQMKNPGLLLLKKEGFMRLYKGYSKTFCKVFVGSCTYLPLNDYFSNKFNNGFYGAVITSFISTLIIHPFDYLKTIHIYDNLKYHGFEIRKYYKGLPLNMARQVPHFTITMSCINWFNNKSNNNK